ncbi:MAG: CDP-diglyceride synthetase [Acidimicrobiales bacterium]|nr:CDP-diglyceride synthetase [Acidimicrobiales bacterium]
MDDQKDRPGDPTEGVRIIGAEEAAEAMERGDVAARRSDDEPRFGDRPPPPPAGPRPALRFPLDASADPARIERPPVQPAPDPVTGPVELPHWTEPATGEVPKVLIGDDAPLIEDDGDDLDAWSSFATSAPRWRDADDDWADDDNGEFVESLRDDEPLIGALQDTDDQLTHDQYHSFDDLEERVEERREARSGEVPLFVSREGDTWSAADLDPAAADATHVDEHVAAHEPGPAGGYAAEPAAAHDDWAAEGAYDEQGNWLEPEVAYAQGGYDEHGNWIEPDPAYAEGYYDEHGQWVDEQYDQPACPVATRQRPRRRVTSDSGGGGGERDVQTAVVVGVVFAVAALVALKLGPKFALILVVAVLALAAAEYFNGLRRAGYEAATLVGIAACVTFPLAVYWRGPVAFGLMAFLTVAATLGWYLVGAAGEDARVVEGAGATLLGIFWIGALGSFAALMLTFPDGRGVLLTGILATVAYDVGGFFVGRQAGRRPLSGASPNKTIEGLLGGGAAAIVVTVIAVGFMGLGPWDTLSASLLLGIGAAVAAPLGDLCQSLVKRDLGIKDMGSVLPGHGGVFDRFDSMLFVLPMVFWLVYAIGHWGA